MYTHTHAYLQIHHLHATAPITLVGEVDQPFGHPEEGEAAGAGVPVCLLRFVWEWGGG